MSGVFLAGVVSAALAGLVSLFTPSVLRSAPGYFLCATGLTGHDLTAAASDPVAGSAPPVAGPATASAIDPGRPHAAPSTVDP